MKRVLVIGGGMAGGMAALAAREAGTEVVLASRAPGATALCSGLIEVAGDPSGTLPPEAAAAALADREPAHPYARLRQRLPQLGAALELLHARLAPLFPASGGTPAGLFGTSLGTVRPAAFAQASQAPGALRRSARVAVGFFSTQPAFLEGQQVAAGLRDAGFDAVPCALDYLDREERLTWSPFQLAEALDQPAEAQALGRSIRRAQPQAAVLLLPALVGLEHADEALVHVEREGGLPCAELLGGTPSVPGYRLQRALERALVKAGVNVEAGEVTALADGTATLRAAGGDRVLTFDEAVLAAGRFVGGGVRREQGFAEPLLGLPLWDGGVGLARQPVDSLLGERPGDPCAAFRVGVRFDGELRPFDRAGELVPWLRVAGALLGGGDASLDGAGLGLAAFSGYLAGRLAAGLGAP